MAYHGSLCTSTIDSHHSTHQNIKNNKKWLVNNQHKNKNKLNQQEIKQNNKKIKKGVEKRCWCSIDFPSEGVHRFDCVLGLKIETVASC